ncbi:transmembrane protein, putative (macronuclear) [Tetrahymena thermophila SB210]|uniref:Transmembrane protein, putative n=1 Tax=Tetrahymena thermophila (strain SB210) TaxID=312017 RepID=W7X812_TETTS|nr:transmembrane protein, putative [Tetrahymena thermophila SB210]EWS73477.1 transmembrane protein, putative [Tetrahymena thermophila SB210]|eukprot:XP_012653959.1 transmembrane protein, putative [Tetrahymena thermophila SB210]
MSSQSGQQSNSNLSERQVFQEQDDQRITGDDWKLDLSQEDRDLANEVEDKLKEVQKQMEIIEQKTKMLQNRMNFPFGGSGSMPNMEQIVDKQRQEQQQTSDSPEAMPMPPKIDYKDFPVIDSRGNLVQSREQVIERYHNSLPFIRCLELPFCYVQIKKKIQFWTVSSVGLSLLYSSFYLVKDRKPLKTIQFKPVIKHAGLIFLVGSLFSTLETIYFNDYCDINSYHYQDNNRAETIKYLKQKILASQRRQ